MSSNELIDVMREFGVEVRLLGTEEEPSPGGLAVADMLMEIHRLRTLTSNLAYDAIAGTAETGITAAPQDDGLGGDAKWIAPSWAVVEAAGYVSGCKHGATEVGAARSTLEWLVNDSGLVVSKDDPRLAPLTVSDEDVRIAREAAVFASGSGDQIPSIRVITAILEAYVRRVTKSRTEGGKG